MRETVVGGDFRPSNAKKEKPHQNRAEAILGSQDLQKKERGQLSSTRFNEKQFVYFHLITSTCPPNFAP